MLDENIYLEPDINSKFSKEEQTKILDWIGKIDSNDKTIIQIPQKGLVDEKMRETEARRFLSKHKIDIENTRIWEINTEISMKYNSKKSINSWWQFWK